MSFEKDEIEKFEEDEIEELTAGGDEKPAREEDASFQIYRKPAHCLRTSFAKVP